MEHKKINHHFKIYEYKIDLKNYDELTTQKIIQINLNPSLIYYVIFELPLYFSFNNKDFYYSFTPLKIVNQDRLYISNECPIFSYNKINLNQTIYVNVKIIETNYFIDDILNYEQKFNYVMKLLVPATTTIEVFRLYPENFIFSKRSISNVSSYYFCIYDSNNERIYRTNSVPNFNFLLSKNQYSNFFIIKYENAGLSDTTIYENLSIHFDLSFF